MSQPIFQSNTTAISQCKYGPMMYLKHDKYIGRSLEVYGEWYDHELQLLLQLLEPGDTVVDVGANIGTHTIPFAKAVGPTGNVVAFEAQRLIHSILGANILINDLKNVQPMHLAAGHEQGAVKIPILDTDTPNNFGGLNVHQFDFGETVGMIKIDDLNLPQCKLIKIDVEGAEASVLHGAADTIQRCRPYLFVENNNEQYSFEINTALLSLGYNCWWFLAPNFRADNFNGYPEDIMSIALESNLICVPQEMATNIQNMEPLAGPSDNHRLALERLVKKAT